MLIWHDSNKKIDAWNESIGKEEAQQYISSNCIWIEEEINFPEAQENQSVEMYLNEDNTIRYEIVEISPPPPTAEEKILTALAQQKEENLTIMMAQADAYEAEQANSLTIMLALADLYEMGGVE